MSSPATKSAQCPELRIEVHRGSALTPWLADIARLRIQVFREWPYLYDGDAEYEARYLQTYVDVTDTMVAICFDADRVVGASTALPMRAQSDAITAPFRKQGMNLDRILYFGESVLDPHYRGRGIGVQFFEARVQHARQLPLIDLLTFCAVQRDPNDKRRPHDYVTLDGFWKKRGFQPRSDLRTNLHWRELGAAEESSQPMMFWTQSLKDNI